MRLKPLSALTQFPRSVSLRYFYFCGLRNCGCLDRYPIGMEKLWKTTQQRTKIMKFTLIGIVFLSHLWDFLFLSLKSSSFFFCSPRDT